MIRARFTCTNEGHDPRPVEWPVKHPFWCSGYDSQDRPIVVAYADDLAEVHRLWPDAVNVEESRAEKYEFSDRFPAPDWWRKEGA